MPSQQSRRVVCLHGLRRTPADWAGVEAGLGPGWTVETPVLSGDPDEALERWEAPVGAGTRLRHADGLIVEYLEHRPSDDDVAEPGPAFR